MTFFEDIVIRVKSTVSQFQQTMGQARQSIQAVKQNVQGFTNVMGQNMEQFRRNIVPMKQNAMLGARLAHRFRVLTHGMRGFRMEALGVMFFGMMLQRTFTGLLKPVMEAYGVFDLFRVMLLILFIPVMDMLLEPLIDIMTWFMDLPESAKKAIGIFVLLGAIVGGILFVIGAFTLGFGSLIMMFGGAPGKVVASLLRILSGVKFAFGAILAVVTVILFGVFLAWKDNFGNIRAWMQVFWEGLKGMFQGALDIIAGIMDFFVALFTGDWEGVKAAVIRIVNGIRTFLKSQFNMILGLAVVLGLGILKLFNGINETIKGMLKSLVSWVDGWSGGFVSKMFDWGAKIIKGLGDGIKSMAGWIKDAILSLFPSWAQDLIWSAGKFVINIFTKGKKGEEKGGSFGDFIWRPGFAPISFSPQDTLVGFKGKTPSGALGAGGGGDVYLNQTNNVQVVDRAELNRMFEEYGRKLVEDIRRMFPA